MHLQIRKKNMVGMLNSHSHVGIHNLLDSDIRIYSLHVLYDITSVYG